MTWWPSHLPAQPGQADHRNMKRQIHSSVGVIAEGGAAPCPDGTRHTLTYGQYRLNYEVYGSGDRVLV
jgi:hypothetical protein